MLEEKQFRKVNNFLNTHLSQIHHHSASFLIHYWDSGLHEHKNLLHQHSFFEVCYVLEGTGRFVQEEQDYKLEQGTLFCTRPYIQHQILGEKGLYMYWVAFELIAEESDEAYICLYESMKTTQRSVQSGPYIEHIALLWRSLWQQIMLPYESIIPLSTNVAHGLFLSFLQVFQDHAISHSPTKINSSSAHLMYQAELYIRDNLNQSMKLDDLAKYLHVSARHLARLFTQHHDISFNRYVRLQKLKKAEELMDHTDQSLETIALELGFSSVHYFATVFKEERGMPPGQYRKNR